MKSNGCGTVIILLSCSLLSQETQEPADSLQIGNLSIREEGAWHNDSVQRYNPVFSGAASLLLPGAGQIYTGHYVKAGFFLAAEGILGSSVYFWVKTAAARESESDTWRQWATVEKNPFDSLSKLEMSYLNHYEALEAKFSAYSFMSWAIGGYVFNVFDAIGNSNVFRSTEKRSPKTAFLLATVPALGLGQLYNGSLSKAGMVMMGQVSLGLMAYSNDRLIALAKDKYRRLSFSPDSLTRLVGNQYADDWGSYRYRAFTNRNMYLWYSIFFYVYSICDAVVDSYLHDYPDRMKISPDLTVGNKFVTFSLSTKF